MRTLAVCCLVFAAISTPARAIDFIVGANLTVVSGPADRMGEIQPPGQKFVFTYMGKDEHGHRFEYRLGTMWLDVVNGDWVRQFSRGRVLATSSNVRQAGPMSGGPGESWELSYTSNSDQRVGQCDASGIKGATYTITCIDKPAKRQLFQVLPVGHHSERAYRHVAEPLPTSNQRHFGLLEGYRRTHPHLTLPSA